MRFRTIVLCASFCLPVIAQLPNPNPLVGVWERTSLMRGTVQGQPPAAPEFLIVSPDGFFSESEIPDDRDKVNKPLDQMTKEELVARFSRVGAARGTYTIVGNVFDRLHITDINPGAEGTHQIRNFRIEGDTLILTAGGGARGGEARGGEARGGEARGGGGRGFSGAAGGRGGSGRGGGGGLEARFKRVR